MNTSLQFAFCSIPDQQTDQQTVQQTESTQPQSNQQEFNEQSSTQQSHGQPIQQSSHQLPVPNFELPLKKRKGLQPVRLFENEDTEDADEINALKRCREKDSSDDEPIVAKAKRGVKRCKGRPASVDEVYDIPEGRKIVSLYQSSKKNKATIGFVMDVSIDGQDYKLNSQDCNSSGIINFRCSQRKTGCTGLAKVIIKDLNNVDEYIVGNRTRFKVNKPDLSIDDIVAKTISDHSCVPKTLADKYEDVLTEHALKIVKFQNDHQLNNRSIFTSEVVDHILTNLRSVIPPDDHQKLKEAAKQDKLNLRKLEDRITKALRSQGDTTNPKFNIENQAEFRDYPEEFDIGEFRFDKDFAIEKCNKIWLFYHPDKLKMLVNDEGVMVHDNTWLFGSRPKNGDDMRAFKESLRIFVADSFGTNPSNLVELSHLRQLPCSLYGKCV